MADRKIQFMAIAAMLAVLFVPLSFADWDINGATGQVCFNISPSVTANGQATSPFYTVANVSFVQNTSFWSGNTIGYFPNTSAELNVFNFANGTDVHFFIPIQKQISGGSSNRYCIYVNGSAKNDISEIAPFGLGFDTSFGSMVAANTSAYTATWSGSYVTFASIGQAGMKSPSATGTGSVRLVGRFRPLSASGEAGMIIPYSNVFPYSPFNTSGAGIGTRYGNMSIGWYYSPKYLSAYDPAFNIYVVNGLLGSPYYENGTMYDSNMIFINKTGNSPGAPMSGYINRIMFPYVNASSVEFDWAIAGYWPYNEIITTTDVVYDQVDGGIYIASPGWHQVLTSDDAGILDVYFHKTYDNCSFYMNGANFTGNFTATPHKISLIDMSAATAGLNNLTVSCYIGGTESHQYAYFVKTGADADTLFSRAFGFTLTNAGCSGAVQSELDGCFESYNISTEIDFAAVICKDVTPGTPFACINATSVYDVANVSKNGYTIFYRPDTYRYPIEGNATNVMNVQHIGATFIYYGSKFIPGIEVLTDNNSAANGRFIYIPAQDAVKVGTSLYDRDCGIFYDTTAFCSYSHGVILNEHSVYVSDRNNNWFTAPSTGVTNFNGNVSQTVPAVSVYSIIGDTPDVFGNGIYNRLNCYMKNDTYYIYIQNTKKQNYTLYTMSNSSIDTITVESTTYFTDIPISGLTNVTVFGGPNSTILCAYSGSQNIFLPFIMPNIMPAGYSVIVWAMMLFMVVLTSIVPFAAIILVLWNDIYHILNMSQIATVVMLSIMFGFVNSSFNMERGIKHMLIMLGIATAYIATVAPYANDENIPITGFDGIVKSFADLASSNDIASFVLGIPGFVVNLFILILALPVTFMTFVLSMLQFISLPLYTAAMSIAPFLTVGLVLYFYLKAYEVLSNRFRPV